MAWKYIIVQQSLYQMPVLFPDRLVHSTVYEGLCLGLRQEALVDGRAWSDPKAVSAGMIEGVLPSGVYGGNETLGIKSRRRDLDLIRGFPYNHGIGFD